MRERIYDDSRRMSLAEMMDYYEEKCGCIYDVGPASHDTISRIYKVNDPILQVAWQIGDVWHYRDAYVLVDPITYNATVNDEGWRRWFRRNHIKSDITDYDMLVSFGKWKDRKLKICSADQAEEVMFQLYSCLPRASNTELGNIPQLRHHDEKFISRSHLSWFPGEKHYASLECIVVGVDLQMREILLNTASLKMTERVVLHFNTFQDYVNDEGKWRQQFAGIATSQAMCTGFTLDTETKPHSALLKNLAGEIVAEYNYTSGDFSDCMKKLMHGKYDNAKEQIPIRRRQS